MLIAQRPVLTEDVVTDARSRFVIEPLEPGFGYTLGNSMRRTLLSSIPGAAVTLSTSGAYIVIEVEGGDGLELPTEVAAHIFIEDAA